eukprot:m.37784 g.37784  ORF g.37784 m.37784 type:complete len:330 (+) comp5579_c0_seq2:273-1262(+)
MEYSLSTVNGQSVYTALPRRPKRNNQAALLIAAVVLLIYGPLKIPFVHKKTRAIGAVDSHTQVDSYDDVLRSMQHRQYEDLKYSQVTLSKTSRGAVFHALTSRRLEGIVVITDGCGPTIDRLLTADGVGVLRGAGRAFYLPMVVEYPGSPTGACPRHFAPQQAAQDIVTSLDRLTRLSGTAGLPVVFAGQGDDGLRVAIAATMIYMIQASRDAESGKKVALTGVVAYSSVTPPEFTQRSVRSFLGVQHAMHLAMVTPSSAPAASSAQDAETKALETNGVQVLWVQRSCQHHCPTHSPGQPAMDSESLHEAIRMLNLAFRSDAPWDHPHT